MHTFIKCSCIHFHAGLLANVIPVWRIGRKVYLPCGEGLYSDQFVSRDG